MPTIHSTLRTYFLFIYGLILCLVVSGIDVASLYADNRLTLLFICINLLIYIALYLLPAFAITHLSYFMVKRSANQHRTKKIVYGMAVITTAITSLLLYADTKLLELYGMHINGFVLNFVITPGGIESLGGSQATDLTFASIAIVFVVFHSFLLWVAYQLRQTHFSDKLGELVQAAGRWYSVLGVLLVFVSLHMLFAYDRFTANGLAPVVKVVPFYQIVSAGGYFRSIGLNGRVNTALKIRGNLNYPRQLIQFNMPQKPYNIVWLVAESWRADTLNETVMPKTWQFAKRAKRYTQHYSGGNGTRAGVFSMFMGMPASYWFKFLQERRGAAVVDVLQKQNYQMQLFTSAKFSYPEFEKTIFANVPNEKMQALQGSGNGNVSWQNDQQNVTDLLHFIDSRDQQKPFFTFMFFESPHARYLFPPESLIAEPYRDDLNYATMSKKNLRNDIGQIKNRYINAVHHLDSQLGRIFDNLEQNKLLENTIVIVLGDHGEEFMEHGFWGHNSTFVDEQVRTPLVVYVPNTKAAKVDKLTSHADIIPTIMPLLGVTNPKGDYSTGINLFERKARDHVYIADWDNIAYIDADVKIVQPTGSKAFFMKKVSTRNDQPLVGASAKEWLQKKQDVDAQINQDLSHFMTPRKKH